VPWSRKRPTALPEPRRWWARFALAAGIVAGATVLRLLVDPYIHDQIPYFIYVASVVVATWTCGADAGVFSTVLAAFVGNYLFVPPRYQFGPHGEDLVAMALFSAVGVGLVVLVGRWKRAERSLHAYASRLEDQADELRALHAEAERISRLKDEFLATVSHELRTPINAVLGWAHMLDSGGLDESRRKTATETIRRNAETQVRLIGDLLDVSRIISGKLHLRLETLDLADVVRSALEAIKPAAEAKEIELRAGYPPDAVLVGDPDRLRQIAWNLLSNAVKFTPKGGRVEVAVERADSQIRLVVSDSGVGIEPQFLPHLFERFRQADSSTTRRHGGLGLGLAIVRHIAELHGGTVRAESAGLGHGATISVALPVRATTHAVALASSDEATRSEAEQARRLVLQGIRVLVVDDEPDARELVGAVLGQYGANVRVAGTAAEAFDAVRQWHPDVLVADIGMPHEDGYSFLRRVRALSVSEGGAVPAAALTAYAQREDRERAFAAGFQEHVAKPVPPGELADVVARLAGVTS